MWGGWKIMKKIKSIWWCEEVKKSQSKTPVRFLWARPLCVLFAGNHVSDNSACASIAAVEESSWKWCWNVRQWVMVLHITLVFRQITGNSMLMKGFWIFRTIPGCWYPVFVNRCTTWDGLPELEEVSAYGKGRVPSFSHVQFCSIS